MTFPSSLFKTIPTGKPSLVQPTLNKIDVEALKRDLKKIEENYPVRVSRAWAQWLQDIDKLLELPNHWEWPLEILQRCSRVPRLVNEDISIPDHLQAMRDKETVETQQVCFFALYMHHKCQTQDWQSYMYLRCLRCKVHSFENF